MKIFSDFGIDIGGKAGVEVKTLCPQCSQARKKKKTPCLSVNTEKGVWFCWHCDWRGSLETGVDDRGDPYRWAKKKYIRPENKQLSNLPTDVIEYFLKRGIVESILVRNKIGWGNVYMPAIEEEVGAIKFPYFRGGELINVKYRDLAKNFRMEGGAEIILYGLEDIQGAEDVYWVEGEIDKLTMEAAGFKNCVSVPNGAPSTNTKNYDSKFDFLGSADEALSTAKRHILFVDSDGPGQKLEAELARRIGSEKCLRVILPQCEHGCKDANDMLVKHGLYELKSIVSEAKPYPVEGIFDLKDFEPEIDRLYISGFQKGMSPGWGSLSEFYTIRPGEWTLITGIPGHGKSELLDSILLNLSIDYEIRSAMFSAESLPLERHAAGLLEKFVGKPFNRGYNERINEQEFAIGKAHISEVFSFILPPDDKLDIESILTLARVSIFRKGIRVLVIDPWNELDHSRPEGMTETEYISKSLSKIRKFARQYKIHIFLVAHPTKLIKGANGAYPVPTPYDVSGSAHFRSKADNAIAVWRDVASTNNEIQIHIQKIRFREVGKVGQVRLTYDRINGRFYE